MSGRFLGISGKDGRAPLDVFCRADTVLVAIMAGEGVAVLLTLAPSEADDRLALWGLVSLFTLWVVLLTVGVLCLARRWLVMLSPFKVAWVALFVLQGMALLVEFVAYGMVAELMGDREAFLWRVSGIAWVMGLLGVLVFYVHYRAFMLALRARDARLEALHARIRPHFLFNTLNTAAALVHEQPERAEQVLEGLADLFRAALAAPRKVTLAEELALVQAYLAIESQRLEARLQVVWSLPDTLPEVAVPSLSIQPLVENAVRHGVEPLRSGAEVHIAVVERGDEVVVSVRNPVAPGPARNGHGVGLASVRERLEGLTGGRGRLEIRQDADVFEARLVLPKG